MTLLRKPTILVYFYAFFILTVTFLAPLEIVALTVNEEFFVALSFIVFIDFFGRTITEAITSTAEQKITVLVGRQISILTALLHLAVQHRNALTLVLRPIRFRGLIRKALVRDLFTLLQARKLEALNLLVQNLFFSYKFYISQELVLVKYVFAGAISSILLTLQTTTLMAEQHAGKRIGLSTASALAQPHAAGVSQLYPVWQAATILFPRFLLASTTDSIE